MRGNKHSGSKLNLELLGHHSQYGVDLLHNINYTSPTMQSGKHNNYKDFTYSSTYAHFDFRVVCELLAF